MPARSCGYNRPIMPETTDRPTLRVVGLGVIVVAAGVSAYAGSFSGPFIFDDISSIPENPYICRLRSPSCILSAPAQKTIAGRPVVSLSLAINYALGGLNVRGYHAFNLAAHLLSALLLFGIVRRSLRGPAFRDRLERSAPWLAGTVALIWTVHPLQTESVTYIIQRTGLLMGLFYLLTLYCAIRGWESSRPWPWFIGAVVACGLGMGCKEVMVSAPLTVLLYDRTFVSGSFGAAARRHGRLYAGLAATWVFLAVLMVSGPRSDTVGFGLGISALDYLRTQAGVILSYLRLCFWPDPLVISYDWPVVRTWRAWAPHGLVVLVLLVGTLRALRRRHWSGFVGAWFFLILAPTSSFVPITTEIAAERRMYLPLAAVITLAVMVGWWGGGYLLRRVWSRSPVPQLAGAALVAALAGVLGYATAQRNRDYRSALAIWTDAVAKQPTHARGLTGLGVALSRAGRIDEAAARFHRALELKPDDHLSHNALGDALAKLGKTDQALEHFLTAIRLRPDYHRAHNNLGNALVTLGRHEEAFQSFHRALDLWPDFAEAHVSLGYALSQTGRLDEAIRHYRRALDLRPHNVLCLNNLGNALLNQKKVERAIATFRQALTINPRRADTYNNLGNALVTAGDLAEGAECYRRAIAIAPDLLPAHCNLGETYRRMRRVGDAEQQYRRALAVAEAAGDTATAQLIRKQLASLP